MAYSDRMFTIIMALTIIVALAIAAAMTYKTMTGRAVIGRIMQRLAGSR